MSSGKRNSFLSPTHLRVLLAFVIHCGLNVDIKFHNISFLFILKGSLLCRDTSAPQKPDSRTTMNTVYVTANFPTIPSAFMDDSTVTVKGNIYSTVREHKQHPTYSTVQYSSGLDEEKPLYYSVNLPKQN